MLWDPIEAINRAILARDTSEKSETSVLGIKRNNNIRRHQRMLS